MQVLKGLLERDTTKRFGCKAQGEGFQELMRHPWFQPIDWDALETKSLPPPFVPDQKKANFDASHELEELLLEDNPLKAKARKANQDNLSAEMRQMEDQFHTYDFRKMQRRSYYPHNQQLISTATATSSGFASSRPATPANELRPDTVAIRTHSGEYTSQGANEYTKNSADYKRSAESVRDKESIRMERIPGDKDYPPPQPVRTDETPTGNTN